MDEAALEIERRGTVVSLWLSRPAVHNAFDAALIEELTQAFATLGDDQTVRVVVLGSRGRSFSAGADLGWMKKQGAASIGTNLHDAQKLGDMFRTIANCPKPTLARVEGAAIGGGVGLIAACDIAIGTSACVFAMSEVRLGLIPATIAPYLVRSMGERQLRRYFQTGERFDAATAQRLGLLHEVVDAGAFEARVEQIVDALLAGAPEAQSETKRLVDLVASRELDATLIAHTAELIAGRRSTAEAGEGLSAFLEKRAANWVPKP